MGYRVLAVDDSLLIHKKIASCLGETEFELAGIARDGEEALAEFERLRPDLVLLDIVMPKMGGKETLERMLELDPTARVIMISSLGADDMVTDCLQVGARRYIQKPFEGDQLLNAMRSVVRTS